MCVPIAPVVVRDYRRPGPRVVEHVGREPARLLPGPVGRLSELGSLEAAGSLGPSATVIGRSAVGYRAPLRAGKTQAASTIGLP